MKPEELKAYGEALSGRIEELEQAIHTAAGENFNINSPKQLGEILFEKMQLPGGKKTKTGYSTAADVLEKLAPEYPLLHGFRQGILLHNSGGNDSAQHIDGFAYIV